MSLPIHVDAYSGYKANERPRYFTLDEDLYEIAAVLDQWYEPSATYFKVQSTEGKTYLLRYDEDTDEWTLQRADSMVMSCWRDQASSWSQLMRLLQRRPSSRSNHASNVIPAMRRFHFYW